MTKISIITPTFNSEKTILKTATSLLNQEFEEFEYIIVDGKSTDSTLQLLESIKPMFKEKRVSFTVMSEMDDGIYDAMNKGIRKASGEIVGIINSDDWYERGALRKVWDCYQKTNFDLFYADLRIWYQDEAGNLHERLIKRARVRKPVVSRDWNHPTMFVRRELYDKYQYRCESLHDDWDLYLQIRNAGYRIEVLNEIIANFRLNGTSHEKGLKKSIQRGKERYRIYRRNGYSRWYWFECVAIEMAKAFTAKGILGGRFNSNHINKE